MKSWRLFRFTIVSVAALLAIGLAAPMAMADNNRKIAKRIVITVDVAEDFTKFVSGEPKGPPVPEPDGFRFPQRGSFFITEGNIYRGGTIRGDGSGFDPTSGRPIGRWFCRGTHLVGAETIPDNPEPWVYTSQLFFLPNDRRSIDTSGTEGRGLTVRVVTGGTGKFKGFTGVQKQRFLGFNKSGGVNLRVTFILRKPASPSLSARLRSSVKQLRTGSPQQSWGLTPPH